MKKQYKVMACTLALCSMLAACSTKDDKKDNNKVENKVENKANTAKKIRKTVSIT